MLVGWHVVCVCGTPVCASWRDSHALKSGARAQPCLLGSHVGVPSPRLQASSPSFISLCLSGTRVSLNSAVSGYLSLFPPLWLLLCSSWTNAIVSPHNLTV